MKKGLISILKALPFLAGLLAIAWAPVMQETSATVVGQVIFEAEDGTLPADLPVTLIVVTGMEAIEEYTGTVAADRTFRFDGLNIVPGATVLARIEYEGVPYSSDPVEFEGEETEIDLSVTIHGTTDSTQAVGITQLHLFMVPFGDIIQVSEYYLVGNAGDASYVGTEDPETGERTTLTFSLPEGAVNLQFDGPGFGERFVELEEGFADTEPVPPGTTSAEVLFTYELPFDVGMQVERSFDLPVSSVVILVNGTTVGLEGAAIFSDGMLETQMGPTLSYTAGPLAAGEPLAFTLVEVDQASMDVPPASMGSGSGSTTPAERNPAQEIGIGLVAIGAAIGIVYLLWRAPGPGPVPAQVRQQIHAIADLDAGFEAGQIPEKAYRDKRRALKREARASLERSVWDK
jgi:hypothetical protein